eukprot:scaffold856_cov326-Pavlova_lutheri.AAC.17
MQSTSHDTSNVARTYLRHATRHALTLRIPTLRRAGGATALDGLPTRTYGAVSPGSPTPRSARGGSTSHGGAQKTNSIEEEEWWMIGARS